MWGKKLCDLKKKKKSYIYWGSIDKPLHLTKFEIIKLIFLEYELKWLLK